MFRLIHMRRIKWIIVIAFVCIPSAWAQVEQLKPPMPFWKDYKRAGWTHLTFCEERDSTDPISLPGAGRFFYVLELGDLDSAFGELGGDF